MTLSTQPAALYGMALDEAQALMKAEGAPTFRAAQLLDWLYQKHIDDLSEAKNIPAALRDSLQRQFTLKALELQKDSESSNLESRKFLFRTWDGRFLESVLIVQKGRRTVCVSTQLGCKIGCTFCASGKGKFGRNLTAGEIVEQVAWIEKFIGTKITNIVFMGMGEPLDNFEATMKALKILQAEWGFGLGARRITVSTSGITPKILEFYKLTDGRVRLSVSLHSSKEDKRSELVPINRKYSLKELVETLKEIHRGLKRDITFEYTLIKDQNDSVEEAEGVARIAKQLHAKVNIIPYNPIREMGYQTPSPESIQNFLKAFEKHDVRVIVRQTAGRDIDAACGQLRLDREDKRET